MNKRACQCKLGSVRECQEVLGHARPTKELQGILGHDNACDGVPRHARHVNMFQILRCAKVLPCSKTHAKCQGGPMHARECQGNTSRN